MNLGQLTIFRAVMTSANLSEAANKLGRTQPAISASIKSLEDQLGLQLFERKGRRMVPVPEARYLLAEAEDIISRFDQVRSTMRDLVGGLSGNLTVAAMPGPVTMLFPRFVANFLAQEADIQVSLLARSSHQISELARAQSIDFGFADFPNNPDTQGMYTAQFLSGLSFLALPETHPLAQKKTVALADLDGEPMGLLQSGHAHAKTVASEFEKQGLEIKRSVESQTFLPILQFILEGRCCAIVDPLTVAHINHSPETQRGIVIRPLREDIRYHYAMLSPLHRPISVIAEQLKTAWHAEVEQILHRIGAKPETSQPNPASDQNNQAIGA